MTRRFHTMERFSLRWAKFSVTVLVVEVTEDRLIISHLFCLSVSLLARLSIFLHAWLPSPAVNKHPNNTSNSHHTHISHTPCYTTTLAKKTFFFVLWCMPSLHPIITSDCNRHLCSQSSFYFLPVKENGFAADTFYSSHTRSNVCRCHLLWLLA